MPRTASKPKFSARYKAKFKVGEEVLYDGVEYFVDVGTKQTNFYHYVEDVVLIPDHV